MSRLQRTDGLTDEQNELLKLVRRFVEEPALARRMGEASLRLVREKFDVNKVNAAILEKTGL